MKTLTISEMTSIDGGGFCALASGLLAGISLGGAGMVYAGIVTAATGGTAGVIIAVAGVAVGIYCSNA